MLHYVFSILALIIFTSSQAQIKPVDFEQIEELQRKERKIVMVFIQTDWCKYCQTMKHYIFNNKQISAILNQSFYTIFLNAEKKNEIRFAGRKYGYKPTGISTGVHELAEALGTINGQLSYPSLCFLNEKNEIIFQSEGYKDPEVLIEMLTILKEKSSLSND